MKNGQFLLKKRKRKGVPWKIHEVLEKYLEKSFKFDCENSVRAAWEIYSESKQSTQVSLVFAHEMLG